MWYQQNLGYIHNGTMIQNSEKYKVTKYMTITWSFIQRILKKHKIIKLYEDTRITWTAMKFVVLKNSTQYHNQ